MLFACSSVFGRAAFRKWKRYQSLNCEEAASEHASAVTLCRWTYRTAIVSVVVEIGILVAAVLLWEERMNPLAWQHYGRFGSNFFFCSLWSSSCNVCVASHFYSLSRREAGIAL